MRRFLSLQVNWDTEKECFESFARETSEFYSTKKSLFLQREEDADTQVITTILVLTSGTVNMLCDQKTKNWPLQKP